MADCTTDEECQKYYPGHPICDSESGMCTNIANDLVPPKKFDTNDLCKKLYGDIYFYDTETNACRVPKCSVKKDYCPKPTKCWRGNHYFL